MGDYILYQPLTKTDRITVFIYRASIALSGILLASLAVFAAVYPAVSAGKASLYFDIFLVLFYLATGLGVFFIHLYIGSFKRNLKGLYILALAGLAVILIKGEGNGLAYLTGTPAAALLLLPVSGCAGFIAAKEAFCFRLVEGYLLMMIMPLFLMAFSTGALGKTGVIFGIVLIAALYVLFASRKVFMPLHCDIGDKSAYR
ncbi:MAG: DUF2301 domain-containing membrane protein [Nitrospiraceae bacterium]|nr:DUF2301 domain-containing membrane protein [Nitrospiraceae bacterium]